MASPQGTVSFYVQSYLAGNAISVGDALLPVTGTDGWVTATAAARGTARSSGIAVSVVAGSGFGTVEIWMTGSVDPTVSGLGVGAASWVRCSSGGRPERFTPVNGGGSDIIGTCEVDGRLHLLMGIFTETMATALGTPPGGSDGAVQIALSGAFAGVAPSTSGQVLTSNGPGVAPSFQASAGGATPTGTGLRKVSGGVEAAAASLLVDADVSASAAIARTKVQAPTGTGIVTVTGGAWDAASTATLGVTRGGTGLNTLATGDILYASGANTLAKLAVGANGQVLTLAAGVPSWAAGGGGGGSFDPTTMNLTSYVRASYAGVPWNGNATPGVSSASVLTQATGGSVPAAGTSVNGFLPLSADGTATYVYENSATRNADVYLSASTYSYAVLVYVDSTTVAAPAASAYLDKVICGSQGDIVGLAVTTSGVRAWHYDGSTFNATPHAAMTTNAWHLVTVKFVAGVLSVQVDNGTAATIAKGAVFGLGSYRWMVGASRGAAVATPTVFTKEQVLENWTSAIDQSANFANYKTYLNSRYGLSL